MARFVLDTNVILYFLGGRLVDPFPAGDYAISVLSELEILAYPGLVSSEEQRVRGFLADIPITDLTQSVKHHAVDLRKRFGLKLPDAIRRRNGAGSGSNLADQRSTFARVG